MYCLDDLQQTLIDEQILSLELRRADDKNQDLGKHPLTGNISAPVGTSVCCLLKSVTVKDQKTI